jgi:hypothetical protein
MFRANACLARVSWSGGVFKRDLGGRGFERLGVLCAPRRFEGIATLAIHVVRDLRNVNK